MKIVAFVPIRLNSKRVIGKNLKLLGGKPLISYMLETLTKVTGISEIYVFCSSEQVLPYLPKGVLFLKRNELLGLVQ
jgi:CMP-N-acetylneuraminic acid synthetase